MTSTNVLPSAPELYPMNEITQINAEDFRLKKSQIYKQNYSTKPTTTDRSLKNIKEHIPSHTSQLWVLVQFLLDYHQQPLQQP